MTTQLYQIMKTMEDILRNGSSKLTVNDAFQEITNLLLLKFIEPKIINGNAHGKFSMPLGTFIPNKLAIKVGIIKRIEMSVSCFITTLRLLEITEAKASIIPAKISR